MLHWHQEKLLRWTWLLGATCVGLWKPWCLAPHLRLGSGASEIAWFHASAISLVPRYFQAAFLNQKMTYCQILYVRCKRGLQHPTPFRLAPIARRFDGDHDGVSQPKMWWWKHLPQGSVVGKKSPPPLQHWINFWGAHSVRIPTSLGKIRLPAVPRGHTGHTWHTLDLWRLRRDGQLVMKHGFRETEWYDSCGAFLKSHEKSMMTLPSHAIFCRLLLLFLQGSLYLVEKPWLELKFWTWQDVLKIMRHFDSRKDGQVSYNEFCDALPLVQRSQFEVSGNIGKERWKRWR